MPEYIERSDAADYFEKSKQTMWHKDDVAATLSGKSIPAADVEVVRHGEWNENIIGFCNVCMECGAIVERTAIKNKSGELNYCPHCGARMDGKGDGE